MQSALWFCVHRQGETHRAVYARMHNTLTQTSLHYQQHLLSLPQHTYITHMQTACVYHIVSMSRHSFISMKGPHTPNPQFKGIASHTPSSRGSGRSLVVGGVVRRFLVVYVQSYICIHVYVITITTITYHHHYHHSHIPPQRPHSLIPNHR